MAFIKTVLYWEHRLRVPGLFWVPQDLCANQTHLPIDCLDPSHKLADDLLDTCARNTVGYIVIPAFFYMQDEDCHLVTDVTITSDVTQSPLLLLPYA